MQALRKKEEERKLEKRNVQNEALQENNTSDKNPPVKKKMEEINAEAEHPEEKCRKKDNEELLACL